MLLIGLGLAGIAGLGRRKMPEIAPFSNQENSKRAGIFSLSPFCLGFACTRSPFFLFGVRQPYQQQQCES